MSKGIGRKMEKTSPSAGKGFHMNPPKRSDTHGQDLEKRPSGYREEINKAVKKDGEK